VAVAAMAGSAGACGVPKLGARLEKSVICRPDAIFGTPQAPRDQRSQFDDATCSAD
jgi:hypothetical protein